MRLYNYTPSDLVILTNLRRALSYVLCSGWPIRWLEKEKEKEEKEKMNYHVLVTSRRTDKGRDKNGC